MMKHTTETEIYPDANATTPVLPQAARAAMQTMEEAFGNPSSSHITGLRARHILESARSQARKVPGACHGRIIFTITSGATEPHEFAFAQDWHLFGLSSIPLNIPLTRFADFLPALFQIVAEHPRRDLIFICRSGNRSARAADAAIRLGIQNVHHTECPSY